MAVCFVVGLHIATPAPTTYVGRLRSLEATPYSTLNCSQYICAAKRHAICDAQGFWNGCNGEAVVLKEYASIQQVRTSDLQPGDVLDFNGSHVAAYVGNGQFMDSTPERGVGTVNPYSQQFDLWYSGPVRVVRWVK